MSSEGMHLAIKEIWKLLCKCLIQLINNYLESENLLYNNPIPVILKKFRTDGIEYDIYIGQSIAPDRAFNHFYLKNLRLWQLTSMAAIARLTHELLPSMPKQLRTTQLIFVHNNYH